MDFNLDRSRISSGLTAGSAAPRLGLFEAGGEAEGEGVEAGIVLAAGLANCYHFREYFDGQVKPCQFLPCRTLPVLTLSGRTLLV